MTNKEKAAEIAHDLITHQVQDDWWYPRAQEHYEEALEKMGDWKDKMNYEELKNHEKELYDIFRQSLQEVEFDGNNIEELENMFKKHLKVYEPD